MQQKSSEIVKAYGSRENFLVTFNPDIQRKVCSNIEICFFGGAPTLTELNVTYGDNTSTMWLVPQLYNLSEYCGCRDKLQGKPLEECASVIAMEFYYLSVTELMLFFHWFKSGKYGRFYGNVDPLVITTSLRDFIKERNLAYDRHEQEERDRKRQEEEKNAISWEEYCMEQYGEIRPHPMEKWKAKSQNDAKEKSSVSLDEIKENARSLMQSMKSNPEVSQVFFNEFKKKYGMTPTEVLQK